MDFIVQSIDRKIDYHEAFSNSRDVAEFYRLKIEYALIFIMSYLWNNNFNQLEADNKEYIFGKIIKPSIGTILDISRRLDISNIVFYNKRINESINKYPKIRNDNIGHGYIFDDGMDIYLEDLKDICNEIYNNSLLNRKYNLILVISYRNGNFNGMNFKFDGNIVNWSCSENIYKFELGNIYLFDEYIYHRISPFIHINTDEELFLYKDIEEILTGKIKYNKIIRNGSLSIEWNELSNISLEDSSIRRKSGNGTIISTINKNYKRYIEVGVLKKKLLKFLLNKASVCATIWGHGGVGKTSTVQSICEDLANDTQKKFDYIIFASAKDRLYNYYTGNIESIEDNIDSFEGLIKSINRVMFNIESIEYQKIIDSKSKSLIVIDDYETFSIEEKIKIEEFIRSLDINYHKVLITTRANLIIGDEFQTNELNIDDTKSFLTQVLQSEFEGFHSYERNLNESNYKMIHEITNGRPLFVYQFAYILAQVGNIEEALKRNIKQEKSAIEFLYGRIYDYLSSVAKDIFVAIGQIVSEDDPTNLIEKIKYILNLENSKENFDNGIRELEKLRIIEIVDTRFFIVYSKEILSIMLSYFIKRNDNFKRSLTSRIQQVTKDKKLDNEQALLANANASRTSRHEEEVIRLYRSILNREMSPKNIKLQAILNLGEYLFNNRGKKEDAIKLFKDYESILHLNPAFIKMYAIYCWSSGRNNEGIEILLDLFSKKPQELINDKNIYVELMGLLLMYRGLDAIQQREKLKEKQRFNEIEHQNYLDEYKKTTHLFNDICDRQGKHLFNDLCKMDDINVLSSSARQNSVSGLYQYVNLCIRLNKFGDAIQICEFVINKYPFHFHEQFKAKIQFCRRRR